MTDDLPDFFIRQRRFAEDGTNPGSNVEQARNSTLNLFASTVDRSGAGTQIITLHTVPAGKLLFITSATASTRTRIGGPIDESNITMAGVKVVVPGVTQLIGTEETTSDLSINFNTPLKLVAADTISVRHGAQHISNFMIQGYQEDA